MAARFRGYGNYAELANRTIAMPTNHNHAASNLADLDKHDKLEEALKTMGELVLGSNTSSDEFVTCMKTANAAARELKQACITRLPSGAINQRCPKHALGLAQRIFNVPELLEMILSTLSIQELLKVQQVNRQFRDCVHSSVTLQRALSLRPDSDSGHLTAPFEDHDTLPGFLAVITFLSERPFVVPPQQPSTPQDDDKRVDIRASIHGPCKRAWIKSPPQHIGNRVRKMLVAQPPPTQMSVKTSCCPPPHFMFGPQPPNHPPPPPEHTVFNSTGLTLGDLLDKANAVIEDHRNCPHAPEYLLNKTTGEVELTVLFDATVTVDAADPVLVRKQRHLRSMHEGYSDSRTWHALAHAFSAAKRAAAANGTPIPTLEEFKASQDGSNSG